MVEQSMIRRPTIIYTLTVSVLTKLQEQNNTLTSTKNLVVNKFITLERHCPHAVKRVAAPGECFGKLKQTGSNDIE